MSVNTLNYDVLLQGFEAANEQEAIDFARGLVFDEIDVTSEPCVYSRHIETVNGVGVYYNYGADYYFFTDEVS